MERDKFMSPEEAKDFGLIDVILEHPPNLGEGEEGGEGGGGDDSSKSSDKSQE